MMAYSANTLKKTSTIEEHFNSNSYGNNNNNNIIMDKAELKRSLQEGLPPPMLLSKSIQSRGGKHNNEFGEQANTSLADHSQDHQLLSRYKSEVAHTKQAAHARQISKDTVSSYVTQAPQNHS